MDLLISKFLRLMLCVYLAVKWLHCLEEPAKWCAMRSVTCLECIIVYITVAWWTVRITSKKTITNHCICALCACANCNSRASLMLLSVITSCPPSARHMAWSSNLIGFCAERLVLPELTLYSYVIRCFIFSCLYASSAI